MVRMKLRWYIKWLREKPTFTFEKNMLVCKRRGDESTSFRWDDLERKTLRTDSLIVARPVPWTQVCA
jgi:hypothetical protein